MGEGANYYNAVIRSIGNHERGANDDHTVGCYDGREQDGVWLPVGLLRPIVPASVADEKARVEVDEMREKGSFELRKHKRDRPLSPGKTRNPESKRGKRQPTRMVVGKACFVRLAYPGSQPGHTYVILSIDLAPPAHRRGAPGELHARLRSLVDGSELVCTIHDLVPLVRCFADQWRQYAASSAPLGGCSMPRVEPPPL